MPADPRRDLLALLSRATSELQRALARLASLKINGHDPTPAMAAVARVLQDAQRLGDLVGRRGIYARAGMTRRPAGVPSVPRVAFDEAIEDLLEREPRLAADWEEVSAVYSREHAFALARSADQELTEAIQRAMGRLVRSGAPVEVGETVIRAEAVKREVLGFTRAYAETVYRTNVATAFSAGRWRALADPEVQIIIPALEYHATLDSSVRENHRAAHGLIMAVDDDRWSQFSPPMGYNCRCAAVPVDRDRLRRMRRLTPEGLVVRQRTPDGAHPDPGFGGGRPDRVIYGFTAAR